jgi:hypothetical protein
MAMIPTRANSVSSGLSGQLTPPALSEISSGAGMIEEEEALAMDSYSSMCAIAAFTLLPRKSLTGLRAASVQKMPPGKNHDEIKSYLLKNGKPLVGYYWSGYIMGTLLVYLQEKRNINLMESDFDELGFILTKVRECTSFILTSSHKKAYLEHLKSGIYSEPELRAYYEAFNERKNEDAGKAMLDGIALLRTNLFYVTNESVILLTIG